MASVAAQIDSAIDVVTPENIAFEYQIAGPLRRAPAYLIDVAIRVLIFVAASVALMFGGAITMGEAGATTALALLFLMWFVLEWFYGALLETFWNGQTLGKRALGLRVLTTAGNPINGLQAVLRNVLRWADSWPMIPFSAFAAAFGWDMLDPPPEAFFFMVINPLPTFAIGLIAPAMNRRWQRLGDLAAGTMVVVEEPNWMYGLVRIQDQRVAELALALPRRIDIGRSTAKALAMYVERRRFFTPARRQEIAMHLGTPLIERYHLPPVGDHDLLLCAIYWKVFITESPEMPEYRGDRFRQPAMSPTDQFEIVTGPVIERRRY